jgi:hypothetical protein
MKFHRLDISWRLSLLHILFFQSLLVKVKQVYALDTSMDEVSSLKESLHIFSNF